MTPSPRQKRPLYPFPIRTSVVADSPRGAGRPGALSLLRVLRGDEGAATAEYAIVIMAAVSFAGLLVTILRSDEVRGVLTDLVRQALSVG
ncbi:hypothetical protein AS850_10555 [Frondihabitans sp. 762G35]|uniref:DUF4244 domain-containing protein n=1 Tax=Frondihabitans sp. 762G35 TaxID=1446794 RepID=UPI000D22B0C3|nr:DUF4244 domain-containing protein [Frondihabitans sp. 762G35]ARC57516.1 hypothetical protein AS850_10555 [Frondihabitans sp. 762G35]